MGVTEKTRELLERLDREFDESWGLTGIELHSPGYHTRLPDGVRVHGTVANLDYARALLEAGAERRARACRVLDTVLALQETRPTAKTYGIWPWFADEPLPQMAPPDWNWADFCGARLAEILSAHEKDLEPELRQRVRMALGHAGWSIFRRNVDAGYTNIAIMGATVTLAAGELLDEPRLAEYGRARFEDFVRHTERHGSFNEYNSPTYTVVAIEECERALRLCRDASGRALADAIRRKGWEIVAEHFHAPTFQWGGPHSRVYFDRLPPERVSWLRERLDCPADRPEACPETLRSAFTGLAGESWSRPVYLVDDEGRPLVRGAVWRTPWACLGSVNRAAFWTQRRPVLGYWASDADKAAVFRMRCLKNGRDFASGLCQTAQERERLLTTAAWCLDQGDHHPGLDRPERPVFSGKSWVTRYSVDAPDAAAESRPWGFALSSGAVRVEVAPAADCRFEGRPVTWRCGAENGLAWVDAVGHDGEDRMVDLSNEADFRLAAACRIVQRDEPETPLEAPVFEGDRAVWRDLSAPWRNLSDALPK